MKIITKNLSCEIEIESEEEKLFNWLTPFIEVAGYEWRILIEDGRKKVVITLRST